MKGLTPQLPTILGSLAAMLIAFICLVNGTSSGTCLLRATAAFLVFAGFGLILRYALTPDTEVPPPSEDGRQTSNHERTNHERGDRLDVILPSTSVADLLGTDADRPEESRRRPKNPE